MAKNNSDPNQEKKGPGLLKTTLLAAGQKAIVAAIGYLVLVIVICYAINWMACKPGVAEKTSDIYHHLSISVIIAWILYLIGYYVWAIYFYNVNEGWTDEDWEKYDKNPGGIPGLVSEEAPEGNPNKGESLGLPPGTVRATLALSLMIAGLAMLIASFSMDRSYSASQIYVDNFEFIKTGFLMMIAFYFGAKSLDILRKTNMSSSTSQPQGGSQASAEKEKPKEAVPPDTSAAG